MIEAHLVAKKLAQIETYLADLRREARPARLLEDIRERRFVEHTLQIAIQAAIDAASHIISEERLGEPRTNREMFELLARHGWIETGLAARLARMVGFRNVLVHGYADVDPSIVRYVVEHNLGDLDELVRVMRGRLSGS